jgi:hypothetical protein
MGTDPSWVRRFLGAGILIGLAGCSSLLPTSKNTVIGPWSNFQEAQTLFQKITPYETTEADLRTMGLDLATNPNITILNYPDVIRRFVPPTVVDGYQLDRGVADCIASNMACRAYEIDQKYLDRNRYGGFWADFFNFRRQTKTTGWTFNAVLLLKKDVVIYKLTAGQPLIEENESKRNPLGPFQAIDSISIIN